MMLEGMMSKITTASAWGAVFSFVWLPSLATVSQVLAVVAQVLGIAWLLFQFWLKRREVRPRAERPPDLL